MAASKNSYKICEVLIEFMVEYKQTVVAEWVNLHSYANDNFTALHFASFFGNIKMSELLIKHGANVFAINHLGINMIHVAA